MVLIKRLGFTLLEVLISLALLGLILLVWDGAQLAAWRANQSAYCLTQATQQISSLKERLKVLNSLNLEEQIAIWNRQNQIVLPQGRGRIAGQSIELCWNNQGMNQCIQTKR